MMTRRRTRLRVKLSSRYLAHCRDCGARVYVRERFLVKLKVAQCHPCWVRMVKAAKWKNTHRRCREAELLKGRFLDWLTWIGVGVATVLLGLLVWLW